MADQVRVNGNILNWGSIIIKVDGDRFYGFDSISYSDKRERTKAYGMGRHQAPRGRTRGKYTVDPVKLRGPSGSVQAFRDMLAQQAEDGVSYGDVEFEVVVQAVDTGEAPLNIEIERCVWGSNSVSYEEGPDYLKDEIEIDAMLIRRNGKTLFDSSQEVP